MDFAKIVRTKSVFEKAVGKFKGLIQQGNHLKENKEHLKAFIDGDCEALQKAGKMNISSLVDNKDNSDKKTAKNIAKSLFMKILSNVKNDVCIVVKKFQEEQITKYKVFFHCGNKKLEIMEPLEEKLGEELHNAFKDHVWRSDLVIGTRQEKPKHGKGEEALIISLMNKSSKKAKEHIERIKETDDEKFLTLPIESTDSLCFGFIKHDHMIYSFKHDENYPIVVGGSLPCPNGDNKLGGFFNEEVKPIMEEEKGAYIVNNNKKDFKENKQSINTQNVHPDEEKAKEVRWEIDDKQYDLSKWTDKAGFMKNMITKFGGKNWRRIRLVGVIISTIFCAAMSFGFLPFGIVPFVVFGLCEGALTGMWSTPKNTGWDHEWEGGGKKSRRKRRKSRKKRKRTKKKRRRKRKRTKKKRRRRRR